MSKAARNQGHWVRDFYVAWSEFATEKSFEWVEKWDTRKGEDRNIRRLMEKENKKVREDHRKEYIDTVKVSRMPDWLTKDACGVHPAPRPEIQGVSG